MVVKEKGYAKLVFYKMLSNEFIETNKEDSM